MTQLNRKSEQMSWEGEAPAEPRRSPGRSRSLVEFLGTGRHTREGDPPRRTAEPRPASKSQYPIRKKPAHGVLVSPHDPTIVFLTVCTKNRDKWLASPTVHKTLCSVWQKATAWRVGRYVIMPDHVHLFVAWIEGAIPLENWVTFWKSQYTKSHPTRLGRWQAGHWDTRLRGNASYDAKWEYVRHNPVRHGLVASPDEWPYQGEMYVLDWSG